MKGFVFTEFLEMVEGRFSPEVADVIIGESDLSSGGAYTAIGTYDPGELLQLTNNLSRITGTRVSDLLRDFGEHLFPIFAGRYPELLQGDNAFSFLERLDGYVHLEVRKLYADADVPSFECKQEGENQLRMIYRSTRSLADLAEGLLRGCINHFGERISIQREDLAEVETCVHFVLTKEV